jgi:restriction system protein
MTAWQPEQEAISIQIPHMCQRCPTGACPAEGYTTYRSPEGADGGVNILAAVGELG